MITPKWLYNTNDLEKLEHAGRCSEAEICLACDKDGWRFGYMVQLEDRFSTYRGHSTPPSPRDDPLRSRQETVAAAAEAMRRRVAKDEKNPKAASEVRGWLNRLSPPKEGQLAFFGGEV